MRAWLLYVQATVEVILTSASEPTSVSIRYAVAVSKEERPLASPLDIYCRIYLRYAPFSLHAGSTSHQYHSTVAEVACSRFETE